MTRTSRANDQATITGRIVHEETVVQAVDIPAVSATAYSKRYQLGHSLLNYFFNSINCLLSDSRIGSLRPVPCLWNTNAVCLPRARVNDIFVIGVFVATVADFDDAILGSRESPDAVSFGPATIGVNREVLGRKPVPEFRGLFLWGQLEISYAARSCL